MKDNIRKALIKLEYRQRGDSFVYSDKNFSQEVTIVSGMYIVRSCENGTPYYWIYQNEETFMSAIIEER